MKLISLYPAAPFRLDLTVWALRRRANNIVDRWDEKTYRRVLPLDGRAVDIAVMQTGPQDDPELNIEAASSGLSPEDESAIAAIVERTLGTGQDLFEFYRFASEDAQLSQLAQRYRGLKPPRFPTLFEAVINGIASQQITLTLGIILLNRLATDFGNNETLPGNLRSAGIGYTHMAGLGGLRHARKDSPNMGWHNSSFRGFADYMQTEEFEKNLEELIHLAESEQIALMCAEALPWRCHRSLIADALWVRDIRVEHIMSMNRRSPHTLTPFGQVNGLSITYPPDAESKNQLKSI
ncbi:MAG: DUF488 family protein [Candidatus Methanoperedens sp.]|nr:DUF488 family protein [Candidatus Methanoperedens sp.]CAG1006119.1 hypothetical protein METP1_03308 [Methanosarcinales archaeon]